jgi:hypothetical protein
VRHWSSERSVAAAMLAAIVALALVMVPAEAADATSPTLILSTASGAPGSSVLVRGRGYPARTRVAVYVSGASARAALARTDSRGRLRVTLIVPSVAPGDRRIVVGRISRTLTQVRSVSDIREVYARARFRVKPQPAPTPSATPSATPIPSAGAGPGESASPDPGTVPTPSPAPSPPPEPSASPSPGPTPASAPSAALAWGLIGNDGLHLDAERAAGITTKVLSLSWRKYMAGQGTVDAAYVARKRAELTALRDAGFAVILSLGYHDTPGWILALPDSRYVNQYGVAYGDGTQDLGDANLVFNPVLREHLAAYIARVFADLGTDLAAVRVGGGRYGELTYPPAELPGSPNSYWAFDRHAQARNPVAGWRPGDASPTGEAGRFLEWYLDALADYQTWQIETVRRSYAGMIMVLYPSWGIRPGQAALAVADNLAGRTSAELNGEIQRGFDFARQVGAIADPAVVVTTTWLDADGSRDGGVDQRYWSPVHFLASLAAVNPVRPALYGENTGQGSKADLAFTRAQAGRFGLLGFAWYREAELFAGTYATLADYAALIAGG